MPVKHQHRAAGQVVATCYMGPVSARENRAAHGNVCFTVKCRCGATRKTNVNGRNVECGPWVEVQS